MSKTSKKLNFEMKHPSGHQVNDSSSSSIRVGDFNAVYSNEPLEYRQQQLKWILICRVIKWLVIGAVTIVLAVVAEPFVPISFAGVTGLCNFEDLTKVRSP
jgi:hypothetical protein